MTRETETGHNLWRMLAPLTIWALHFLACYVAAAILCAKYPQITDLAPLRHLIFLVTFLAVAAVAYIGFSTLRIWRHSLDGDLDYDHDTPEERHRFLAHVTLMLCALSVIGILYVAIPAAIIGSCR
ncbi:hypothetical protein [Phyllobacterium zundukense]|jgi:type VI protein secretion system component VasK|uniref:Uncharacterized protein n=1 Tax=Phyllobacterium zundukense TaxID=1867719 RepID=A0ACD4D901_9HYPH|nr:hypothetical protein [Phyllobacterium zundukense]UXN62267.1 hypothetical protein N8E88_19935 [Phyllobacterium zundukense]